MTLNLPIKQLDKLRSSYLEFCQQAKSENRYRTIGNNINRIRIDFTSNDYLGMSSDKDSIYKGYKVLINNEHYSKSSRLLATKDLIYTSFEEKIANTYLKQKALIFSSGYQLNSSVIPSLLDKSVTKEETLVFCDKLVHNSISVGCKLANIRQIRYRHNDLNHLEHLLKAKLNHTNPKIIITEGVFSMEGTIANIKDLIFLKNKYNALLYVDDAHGIGMLGENGYGCTENHSKNIDIIVGTFGKAIGANGAFISADSLIVDYLINKCPGFIYSTAPSPASIAMAHSVWDKLPKLKELRQLISNKVCYLRDQLLRLGLNVVNSQSNIIPIIFRSNSTVMAIKEKLIKSGIATSAIRDPTVPKNTSRIRINICAKHSYEDIEFFLDKLNLALEDIHRI